MSPPKYKQVAERVRAQIADGMLMPGEPAPSGAALARVTGYSTLTCRKALRILISDGVLVAGASPGARPRVPALAPHTVSGLWPSPLAPCPARLQPAAAPLADTASTRRDRRLVGNRHRPCGDWPLVAVPPLLGARRQGSECRW